MAVKIRCRRTGAKNDPSFRIVAADMRFARDGKCLENLGWYDPKRPGSNFQLDMPRIEYWQRNGALVSDTVRSLLKKARSAAPAATVTAAPETQPEPEIAPAPVAEVPEPQAEIAPAPPAADADDPESVKAE